jgi:hypothetical protein
MMIICEYVCHVTIYDIAFYGMSVFVCVIEAVAKVLLQWLFIKIGFIAVFGFNVERNISIN